SPVLVTSQYNSGDGVNCNGSSTGLIDLTLSGGLAPYTVAWTGPGGFTSNAIDLSGLAAGTYNATITDAAGCSSNAQATLTEPTPIAISGNSPTINGF